MTVIESSVMRSGSRARRAVVVGSALAITFALACSSKEDDAPGGSSGAGNAGASQGGAGATTGAGRGNTGGTAAGTAGASGAGARGGSAGTAPNGAGNGGRSTAGAAGRGTAGSAALAGTSGRDPTGDAGAAGAGVEPVVCSDGNCHYVRADASGSGDGSSWADAYVELPKALARGHAYFVASGSYPAHDFDDAPAGDARIRIVRATTADHGTSDGWNDAYATGECAFGVLDFKQPAYDFEGRGALHVVGDFQGTVVRIAGDSTHFSGVDVDGSFAMSGGKHVSGACTGMEISGDDVVVSGNHVHDIADDGVVVGGNSRLLFEGNEIDRLMGCGTDGNCGPCDNGHSDGLEIYAVHDSDFVGNFAHDIASTSTFFFGNWADELGDGPADYCENILLANNVLYNPDTGFVVYVEDVRGVTLVGNTIWGQHQGRYGGLAVGVNVKGLEIDDNVILSINYEHLMSTFDPAEHHGDYNLFGVKLDQWMDGPHDVVALDPGFAAIPDADADKVLDPKPEDFTPAAGSPLLGAGSSDAPKLPARDFFGTVRASPPSVGAVE